MITETLGDWTYELEPLLASECIQVWSLVSGITDLKSLATELPKALGEKPELAKVVAKLMAGKCRVQMPDGSKPTLGSRFELHFAGNMFGLIQWLIWCVAQNFAGFSST
jgi:hypothetical protein